MSLLSEYLQDNFLFSCDHVCEVVALVEAYAKEQGMWRDENSLDPEFTDTLELDMAKVVPCISGPKRPQDRIALGAAAGAFAAGLEKGFAVEKAKQKDPGFDPYWLAVAFERIRTFQKDSPDMLMLLMPVSFQELLTLFDRWREEISSGLTS